MKKKSITTAQVIHEYGETVTTYYLLAMLLFLPLYKQNGFANIADAKFTCYRFLTIAFVIIGGGICFFFETISNKGERLRKKPVFPIYFIFAHLILNIISFIFSTDHKTSLWGSGSWHIGIITQMLFLISALLVYYYYIDKIFIWIAAEIGLVIASALTALNRFDIYPIDMGNKYPGFISTLGQTNWATLYVACLMGVSIAFYMYIEKKALSVVLLICNAIVFYGAWVIGSDTILVVMFAEFFILFGIALRSREMMQKFANLMLVFGITTEIVYITVFKLFYDSFVFVDENDAVNTLLKKQIGILLIIVALVLCLTVFATRKLEWKQNLLKNCYRAIVAVAIIAFVTIIILMIVVTKTPEKAGALANIRMLRFDDDWGTHRALNWRCTVTGIANLSVFRKTVGIGQGNFRAYIYTFPELVTELDKRHPGFYLLVAHNEYLNMFLENGLLGCLSYIGVLVSSFAVLWKRAEKHKLSLMALLSLSGYIACSMFFFQHVYATSFMYIFVAMALSEIGSCEKNVA